MKNKFSKIAENNSDDNLNNIKKIEMRRKQISFINLLVLFLFCFLLEYICIVQINNNILASLLLFFVCLLIVFKAIQYKMLLTKLTKSLINLQVEDNTEKIKYCFINNQSCSKYFELTFSVVVITVYVSIFEVLIRSKGKDEYIIIISFFLTLLSNAQLMNLKDHKIPLVIIGVQQVYSMIKLQLSIQFDITVLGLSLLYFFFQISLLNTAQNSKKKKMISKQNQKSKAEIIMCLYQSILSVIPEGIAVINSDKKLLYANPTLKKILNSQKKSDIQNILLNLGKQQQVEEQLISQENDKCTMKIEENHQKCKKSIDAFSGISKNKDDHTQKHDNLSTNYSEIFKDRKKDTVLNTLQGNEKVQVLQEKIKKPQLQAQCSISYQDQTPKQSKLKDQSNLIEKFGLQVDNLGQNKNEPQLQNPEVKNKEDQHKEDFQQNQENQVNFVDNQQQLTQQNQNCVQKNKDHIAPNYQQNLQNINIKSNRWETQKSKTGIIQSSNPQSAQLFSDQSEIISYQGFGFNFCDEDQSSIQKKIQSCSFIQMFKPNESLQNRILQDTNLSRQQIHQQKNINIQNAQLLSQLNLQQKIKPTNYLTSEDYLSLLKQQIQEKDPQQNRFKITKENIHPDTQIQQENQNTNKIVKLSSSQQQIQSPRKVDQDNEEFQKQHFNINQIKQSNQKSDLKVKNSQMKQQKNEKSPFSLKLKQINHLIDNQIKLQKTNVSSILENIFRKEFLSRSSQQNNFNNSKINLEKTKDGTQDNLQINGSKTNSPKKIQKRNSFISHIKRESKEGLTYVQQSENGTKLQVNYKEKDIVLQFLSVDIMQENNKKDPLVLIIVQDMWKELYEKKVQDIQKDKMKIFASLSHELRTPLNCSISMLEVLKDEIQLNNPQYIEQFLNPALFSNKLLLNQINDILDFVQMDSGKFKYSFQEFNILNLLKDCQKLINMQAQMKNIEIKISHEQNTPEVLCSDPNRIRQIILNFLSNSLKFTNQGYIELGVKIIEKGIYKLYVKDTGIGIKQENINKIFQFCAKINYSKQEESLNTQGCGLGLTISNSIAKGLVSMDNIQRGGIVVESDYGLGSTFSILIQDMSMSEGDIFSLGNQNEHAKLFVKIPSKDIDCSRIKQGRTLQVTPLLKKRFDSQPQDQIRINQKKNFSHYLCNQQVIPEDEQSIQDMNQQSFDLFQQLNVTESQSPEMLRSQKIGRKYLSTNIFSSNKQNQIDSSVVIEIEDDEQTKRYNFNPNFSINTHNKFQEEQDNSPNKSNLNPFRKTPSIQLKSIEQLKQIDHKSNSQRNEFYSNHFNTDINHSKVIEHVCPQINSNEDTKQNSNQSIDRSFNRIFSNLSNNMKRIKTNSSVRNESYDKQNNQEQEGFTSYIPCYKLNEIPALSSQFIFSSNKISIPPKIGTQQQMQMSISEDKTSNQTSIQFNDPQIVIEQIILNNTIKKQKCHCPQIIIVDDNQFNLYALSKTFQQFQFQCLAISDGQMAINSIKEQFQSTCCQSPKMIFMDIEMPIKNGYEVAIEINEFYKNAQFEQVPIIIACTAYVGQEDQEKAFQAGMRDFINKPILKSAFQQLILNWQDSLL